MKIKIISASLIVFFSSVFLLSSPAFACEKPADELAILAVVPPTAFIVGPIYGIAWLAYKACRNTNEGSNDQETKKDKDRSEDVGSATNRPQSP